MSSHTNMQFKTTDRPVKRYEPVVVGQFARSEAAAVKVKIKLGDSVA